MHIVKATYDGHNLVLDEPLPLAPDTRVRLTVTVEEPGIDEDDDIGATTFLDVALSLNVCGPPDWSERVDFYMGQDMSGYSDNPDLAEGKI